MLEILIESLFTIWETILLYWIINALLSYRFAASKKNIIFGCVVIIDSILVQIYPAENLVFAIIQYTAISLVIVELLYKGNILIKLFFILLCNYIFLISDIISGNFLSVIYQINVKNLIEGISSFTVLFAIFSKIIASLFIGLYCHFFKKLNLNISIRYWICMDLIISFYIFLMNFLMMINSALQNQSSHYSSVIFRISVCFLFVSVVCIYLFGEICLFYQKEQQRYALEISNKALERQLEFYETSSADLRKMRHDIKNNLGNILYLLKENQIEESVQYINAITSTLEATKSVVQCGNKYIDSILNYEIAICKRNNIDIQFEVDNVPDLNILPTDLSSILSNVLNNAIEANLKIVESERYVSLKMFCYKNYLSVILKNPYKHKLVELGDVLITNKINKLYHGYGLKSVKSAISRYGGTCKYTYENNIFTSIIMLPIDSKND